jgi:hypothetical protein
MNGQGTSSPELESMVVGAPAIQLSPIALAWTLPQEMGPGQGTMPFHNEEALHDSGTESCLLPCSPTAYSTQALNSRGDICVCTRKANRRWALPLPVASAALPVHGRY